MAQPYNVFLSDTDPNVLDFEKVTDIQPLSNLNMAQDNPTKSVIPSGEAEALNSSIGIFFNLDSYISTHFSDKKNISNTRAVLSYLNSNVDPTILKFSQDGRVFYQGAAVPGANLKKILESLTSKKQKVLQIGEYFLLSNLTNAPDYIKTLVHPAKLKMCNIQVEFATQPQVKRLNSRPANIYNPPSSLPGMSKPNIQVKTASPFAFYPNQKRPSQPIAKTLTKLDKTVRGPTPNEKRFNVKEPWYKLK